MYMKNTKKLQSLLDQIRLQFELLEKLNFGPKFYGAYHEYHSLAKRINDITPVEQKIKNTGADAAAYLNSFLGVINLGAIPYLRILQEGKSKFVLEAPSDFDARLSVLVFELFQLSKMGSDERSGDNWLADLTRLFQSVFGKVKWSAAGKKFLEKTKIIDFPANLRLAIKAEAFNRKLSTPTLNLIRDYDFIELNEGINELSPHDAIPLSVQMLGLIDELGWTKEGMMQPVYIFQSALPTPAEELRTISKENSEYYLVKDGEDFCYHGVPLQLTRSSNYYMVIEVLYSLLPFGGTVSYKDLIKEIKKKQPAEKRKTDEKLKLMIFNALTNKQSGFSRKAKLKPTEDNGKPLISVDRGLGIMFNNKN